MFDNHGRYPHQRKTATMLGGVDLRIREHPSFKGTAPIGDAQETIGPANIC